MTQFSRSSHVFLNLNIFNNPQKSYCIMWRIKMKRYERSRAGFMILPSSSRSRFLSWKFSSWLDYMSDADSSIIYILSCCMLMGQNLQILRKSSEYFSVQHHHNKLLVTNGVNKARDTNEWLARRVLRRQDNHRTFSHHRLYQLFSRWLLLLATHTRLSLLHQYAWNEAIHK